MTTAIYDGTSSTSLTGFVITKTTRRLLGDSRASFEDIPGRAGAWTFGEERGDRTITLSCAIVATSASTRRTAVTAVADWVDKSTTAQLILSDESDRYYDAILTESPDVDEWLRVGQFELTFRVGPFAYKTSATTESWTASDGVAHTWTPADTVGAFPVITITPNADISSFILTVNGTSLTYGATLHSGSTLTVNSISYTATTGANIDTNLTGAYNPANVAMATIDGDFPLIVVGQNSVTLDTPGGQTAAMVVTWRRRYR